MTLFQDSWQPWRYDRKSLLRITVTSYLRPILTLTPANLPDRLTVFKSSHSEVSPILTALVVLHLFQSLFLVTQIEYILLLSQPRNLVLGQPQGYTLNMTPIQCHGDYCSQPHTINITLLEGRDLFARVHLARLTAVFSERILDLRYVRLHF